MNCKVTRFKYQDARYKFKKTNCNLLKEKRFLELETCKPLA